MTNRPFYSDMTPLPIARRAELDPHQLRAFRQLLDNQDPTNPVLTYDDDDLLHAYGALARLERLGLLRQTAAPHGPRYVLKESEA